MPPLLIAVVSGLIAGGTLVIGSVLAIVFRIPKTLTALIMAFGAGVLISALAFDLVDEAVTRSGVVTTAVAFLAGAIVYVGANLLLDRLGQRSRSGGSSKSTGGGIAIGALLDGIPESAVLGLTIAGGGAVSVPLLVAVAISNLPEGIASTAEMRTGARSTRSILMLWSGIALACALATIAGFLFLGLLPEAAQSAAQALAAGAILAMICDTMIPDGFTRTGAFNGLAATVGFLLSFALHNA